LPDDNKTDSENSSFLFAEPDGPVAAEIKAFAPDQMIRCEECLRANGPTRINCLYCGAVLPVNESSINLQKPALRPLEKWEQGYNNILLPSSANHLQPAAQSVGPSLPSLTDAELAEAADLLKLTTDELAKILAFDLPLPVARASTIDEALLVQRRLGRLRLDTVIVSDADLGVIESPPIRVRSIEFESNGFIAYQTPETSGISIAWPSLLLTVAGRLVVKRVELREQRTSRAENRILDANEFFTDEFVVEVYTHGQSTPFRINANSFDFSCLRERKRFVAGENLRAMLELFREHAPQLECDDSFSSARKALETVWPSERQIEARGWRRDRPGKYSVGSATEISNEMQFLRYSRLRHYFSSRAKRNNENS
jgi:hypothetical protein